MDRSSLTFALISAVLLVFAFSISSIKGADDACDAASNNETQCCGTEGCLFVNCTGTDNKTHEGCHSNTTMQNTTVVGNFCKDPEVYTDVCTTPEIVTSTAGPATESTTLNVSTVAPITNGSSTTTEAPTTSTSVEPTTQNTTISPTTSPSHSSTSTSTSGPSTNSTPAASTTTSGTTTKATPKGPLHGFDGASFIGGMVLVLGLFGIFFIVYKVWWKPRKESRYHSL